MSFPFFIFCVICARIIKGRHNNMPPVTSNNRSRLHNQEATLVEKKVFQIPPRPFLIALRKIVQLALKRSN